VAPSSIKSGIQTLDEVLQGIRLGDNAAVLVEVALEEAGHLPEVSYGTQFFQDWVEGQVIYLPVYSDDAAAEFQTELFETAPNVLHAG